MTEAAGYISGCEKGCIHLVVPLESTYFIEKQDITQARVIFDDGRRIRPDQRKKVYAILGDIADWCGDPPEVLKELFKMRFLEYSGGEWFSLSDCSVKVAADFITYLINVCFTLGVPTRDTMLNRADDISAYLYSCLYHRKCCICNDKAEIHHCEGSRVGMGFNRNNINNLGRRAIALCRKHHHAAHSGEAEFFEKYHVYGIELDKYLLKKLKL